jgi:hypothetical protein
MNDAKPRRATARQVPPILAGYKPLRVLWTGAQPPYQSEQQARWALRQHRAQLAAASALALHQGRLLVHPQLFVQIVERSAIEAVQRRVAGHEE